MSRISEPRLPDVRTTNYQESLATRLYQLFRELATQLNNLSEGRIVARHNSATAAPTTGTHARGDIVWNSEPAGTGVVFWVCTAAGAPGTWRAVP